jgi:predicted dehydrogenase
MLSMAVQSDGGFAVKRHRLGLVGGGPGSFIGAVHRIAAELDRRFVLVAGAFSSDAVRSAQAGGAYGIDPGRAYATVEAMIAAEAARADGIEVITIATPNHLHLQAAHAALDAGLAVMSDKPATASLAEARELAGIVAHAARPYALSYTYTGYPLVRQARALVAGGALGEIRKVVVEYPQGWLAAPIERAGSKQAGWRTDPARAGAGGCSGDIGVHAFNLAEFVTGQPVKRLLADLATVVPGRALDDDVAVLLRFAGGARGVLMASQISIGELNGLRIRVYGSQAAIDWRQEQPNVLTLSRLDGRVETLRTGDAQLAPAARAATRLPGGHPEGYLEAFANLYGDFADLLEGRGQADLVQGVDQGVRGMAFIETAVAASRAGAGWVDLVI